MAEAAVNYVLCKLADAMQKKAQELHDVSGQIKHMQLELRMIQALLRDADSKRSRDESVKEWVNQVRDMAYRIEDLIDTFLVEIEENHLKTSGNLFTKQMTRFRKTYKLNKLKLGGELKEITQELQKIYQLRTYLGIKVLGADNKENGELPFRLTKPSDLPFRPTKPYDVDDSEVVGLEDDKCKIINQLLDRSIPRRTVLSIVGTGGLGKTTLAQKVYKSAALERQFDCCTWLSISQKFNLNDLLREILYSIDPQMKHKNPPVTDEDLPVKLQISLRYKRYLIILDDVWTIDLWERLKIQLPDPNNASRVIITSRLLDVANVADCKTTPHKLSYLDDDKSLALLFRKAFQQHIEPENYPYDLLQIAQKLMKKCGGLPLALVVLGGILTRRKPTFSAWSKVEMTMDWHNEDGEKCMKILAMSYEDLPYHLKSCFLYFASFPEDYKISGKHVTKMWVAEGFVLKDGAGLIEDRAEAYLEELVQRCLIQVTEKSWNGSCKYCSMHDLLRDLAIHEAMDVNFISVFSKVQDGNQLATRKPRRAALQFRTLTDDGIYSENTRSLLCFGFGKKSSDDCGFRLLNYSGFRLLRVLTIEHVDMRRFACREWLNGLIHLRYLGFRYCTIPQELFKKNSFYNLETIDLKGTSVDEMGNPNEQEPLDWSDVIIPTLRHVFCNMNLENLCPLKWDRLTNLQTLKTVGQRVVPKLGCNINLRTLGIYYLGTTSNERDFSPQREWETLKDVLRKTEQLVSLRIVTSLLPGILVPLGTCGTRGLSCHEKIQSLHLFGVLGRQICIPNVEMFPTNLTKLTLVYSLLREDPMPIFERLQSLRILRLWQYSFEGKKLICSTGGFPNLEKLELENLRKLCHWDIKEGAMPNLSYLKIGQCAVLNTLPELQNVRTLQELLVHDPSRELEQHMQGEDLYKINHIQSVRITRFKSDK